FVQARVQAKFRRPGTTRIQKGPPQRPAQILSGSAADLPLSRTQPADASAVAHAKQALPVRERLVMNLQTAQQAVKRQRLDKPQPAATRPLAVEPASPGRGQCAEVRG